METYILLVISVVVFMYSAFQLRGIMNKTYEKFSKLVNITRLFINFTILQPLRDIVIWGKIKE
jgi:hypothetical protein